MQIREGGAVPVEEIVAVTMGPDSAVRALHKAVSLGADRSVHLSDAVAGRLGRGRDRLRARQDAASARAPTSCCSASSPTTASATRSARSWPSTCGMPSLTQVIKMDVDSDGLRCERQAEYGYDTVQVKLPAVISVGDAINEPRYPSLKAIMGAKKKPLDTRHRGGRADRRARKSGGEHSAAQWVAAKAPPGEGRRARSSRTRTPARRSKRSSPGSTSASSSRKERKRNGEHPGLRAALRRRDQQELARRGLRGREARRRNRRRGARDPARRRACPRTSRPRSAATAPRRCSSPRAPRGSRSRWSTRWRRRSPTAATPTRCSAAGCSASRSAPASPRGSARAS